MHKELVETKAANDTAIKRVQTLIILVFLVSIVVSVLIVLMVHKTIIRPLKQLKDFTVDIARGNLNKRIDIYSNDEIGELTTSFNRMVADVQHFTDKIKFSKNYVDNIIKSMINLLIITNEDGIINKVNKASFDILGYHKNDLLGKPISMLFGEEQQK